MKLIVGLGNPGQDYINTRHNVGFATIDFLFDKWQNDLNLSAWKKNKKFTAEISEGILNGDKIFLLKPLTFMNNSGESVGAFMHFYQGVAPQDLTVIHDDLDIAFGEVKFQTNRSSAGHNGIKSIIEKIGTQDFNRVRIGIAKASRERQGDAADFVLKKFSLLERRQLKDVQEKILLKLEKQL